MSKPSKELQKIYDQKLAAFDITHLPFKSPESTVRVVIVAEFDRQPEDIERALDDLRGEGEVVYARLYQHAPVTEDLI